MPPNPPQPESGRTPRRQPSPVQIPQSPKTKLTAEQQLEALRRVQSQAEQRVKLGVELFKAAEAHATSHKQALDQVRREQQSFHDDIRREVAKTLQGYDQWMGQIDESYKGALMNIEERIDDLDQRLDELQKKWERDEKRIATLLDRSRELLSEAKVKPAPSATTTSTPPVPSPQPPAQPSPQASAPATPASQPSPPSAPGRPRIGQLSDDQVDARPATPRSQQEKIYLEAMKKLDPARRDESPGSAQGN